MNQVRSHNNVYQCHYALICVWVHVYTIAMPSWLELSFRTCLHNFSLCVSWEGWIGEGELLWLAYPVPSPKTVVYSSWLYLPNFVCKLIGYQDFILLQISIIPEWLLVTPAGFSWHVYQTWKLLFSSACLYSMDMWVWEFDLLHGYHMFTISRGRL